jgi:hypothetical protein
MHGNECHTHQKQQSVQEMAGCCRAHCITEALRRESRKQEIGQLPHMEAQFMQMKVILERASKSFNI